MEIVLSVMADEENNAVTWWEAFRTCAFMGDGKRLATALQHAALGEAVSCTPQEWDAFAEQAEKLPGWETGPAYARFPFLVAQIELTDAG